MLLSFNFSPVAEIIQLPFSQPRGWRKPIAPVRFGRQFAQTLIIKITKDEIINRFTGNFPVQFEIDPCSMSGNRYQCRLHHVPPAKTYVEINLLCCLCLIYRYAGPDSRQAGRFIPTCPLSKSRQKDLLKHHRPPNKPHRHPDG